MPEVYAGASGLQTRSVMMGSMSEFTSKRGMTIVELLAVLAIIAVLLGLLFPAMYYAREASRRAACANNLHQLGVAFSQEWEVNKNRKYVPAPEGTVSGWAIDILPFIEDQNLANGLSGNPVLDPVSPLPLARKRPYLMTCPSGYGGDSSIATIPASHYTTYTSPVSLGDIRMDSRIPWVFSPIEEKPGPSAQMPHGGGHNVIDFRGDKRQAVRFVLDN
jgi:prepilin-type N-terminal cleavage/methylation domain-containing protein